MISKINSIFNNEKYQKLIFTLARILIGYAFILHGTAKFWEFPISMTGGNGSVELLSMYGIGGVIEILFGTMFITGIYQRLAAFILSGQMTYAYFFMHVGGISDILLPIQNKGELALVYSLVFLMFCFINPNKTYHIISCYKNKE